MQTLLPEPSTSSKQIHPRKAGAAARPKKSQRRRLALLEARVLRLDGWVSEILAVNDVYRRLFEKLAGGQLPMDLALELMETGQPPF